MLTGCSAVAWGAGRKGHVGGAAGGVVGVGREVRPQEGCAQDGCVVRRSWLDPQHTGRAGNLQRQSQTCEMTTNLQHQSQTCEMNAIESARNVQHGVEGASRYTVAHTEGKRVKSESAL